MRLSIALTVLLVAATLSQEQLSKPRAPGNRRRKLMKLHKAGNGRSSTHIEIQPSGAHSQLGIFAGNTKDRPIC